MDAGQLDRRITLQRAVEADDGYTDSPASWSDIATVWAKLMPLSSAERAAQGEQLASQKVTFMIRRDTSWDDLNASDRLTYEGRTFNVLGVREHGRGFYMIDAAAHGDSN